MSASLSARIQWFSRCPWKEEHCCHNPFDRFYREDKARSREKGGSGLGLAIANMITTLHGGTIKIQQNQPKGTKVIVKI